MKRSGEAVWNRVQKVNSELFTLTYGALVLQVNHSSSFVHFYFMFFSITIIKVNKRL